MKTVIEKIFAQSRTIAVVGISDKVERPSYRVAKYLKEHGYRIIPVNPRIKEALGEKCYSDLDSVPDRIDVVDIFRRAEDVLPIVKSAISLGAKTIWMQEGVVNEEATRIAESAGLDIIMDRCMLKEHKNLSGWIYD
ncbi:MAG: CoA-binding protein [bacterium]|nr:CoA-binding protein [bacterium]